MSIEEIKYELISDQYQVSLLSTEGLLLESCNSCIDLSAYTGKKVLDHFDIFLGLNEAIFNLKPGGDSFIIPIISFKHLDRDYLFNMEFRREEDQIVWLLSSNRNMMDRLQDMQQERNSSAILLDRIRIQEKRLKGNNQRLKSLNQELDKFAYIVSHDLKSPLRAVKNLAAWIAEDVHSANYSELPSQVELLKKRVAKMENLIAAILKYSRVGKDSLTLRKVDVGELVKKLFEDLQGSELTTLNLSEKLPVVFTHRTWLHQVFANLISNAIKYGPQGKTSITVGYQSLEEYHQFSVQDNGPGIALEHHEQIFDIFETLDSQNDYENTGIGLTIVRKLVHGAEGEVWVESELGKGARFVFTWKKK